MYTSICIERMSMEPVSLPHQCFCNIGSMHHTRLSHPDLCGHGGILVIIGNDNAPVLAVSKKQKLDSRSSCESERLIELDIGLNHLLWFSILLEFLEYKPAIPCEYASRQQVDHTHM